MNGDTGFPSATTGASQVPTAAPVVARKFRNGDFVGYLYRCYSADGELIYVGSTAGIQQRMNVHSRQSWFYDRIASVLYWTFDNIAAAREAELAAITAERPTLNQRDNPLYAGMTAHQRRLNVKAARNRIPASPVSPQIEDGEPEVTRARMADAMSRVGDYWTAWFESMPQSDSAA